MNWHEYFTYNADVGELVWRERPREHFNSDHGWVVSNIRFAGKAIAHPRPDGYLRARIHDRYYYAHRIIWEMHNGPLLRNEYIDHIDGSTSNNRLYNLRRCSHSQNKMNCGKRRNNTSGFKGVSWNGLRQEWYAQITFRGTHKNLGYFKTAEEAHLAYCTAAQEHHGEFARTV